MKTRIFVVLFLFGLTPYPNALPSDDEWRMTSERTRNTLGFNDDENITPYKLEKKPMKDLEKTLKLPDDTPDEMRKFFN